MKWICFFFLFLSFIASAQDDDFGGNQWLEGKRFDRSDSVMLPLWQVSVDLFNFIDNYPAMIFGLEKTLTNEFSVKGELGPVLHPETFDDDFQSTRQFDKYFGYKARGEFRIYSEPVISKKRRKYFAFDLFWQQDFYQDEFVIDRPGFNQLVEEDFNRKVIGTHVRIGQENFFGKGKVAVGWSLGLGRMIFLFSDEDLADSSNITDFGALGTLSLNFRVSLGLVVKSTNERIF